jgi:hypothetical protein
MNSILRLTVCALRQVGITHRAINFNGPHPTKINTLNQVMMMICKPD